MLLTIELGIAILTFIGGLIGLYVKMQVENANIKAEIKHLQDMVNEDKSDKKEFTKALAAMQKTLHQLDKTIATIQVSMKVKINTSDNDS
jgi:septal ring factor EnvC (AmiA/AmiB activator)